MTVHRSQEVTQLLQAWCRGEQSALDRLVPLVYAELHRLAHIYMVRERPGHSLQTSALVNEAYLRLIDASQIQWQDRAHFIAISSDPSRENWTGNGPLKTASCKIRLIVGCLKHINGGNLVVPSRSALVGLRSIATAALIWVVVGVPIAGVIAAFSVSAYVFAAYREMALTAATLGASQGLWFYLAGCRSNPDHDNFLRLGLVSGGILGLLGFPPVFSSADIIASRPTVAVLLIAAIVGGVAAGLVSARVLTKPLRGRRLGLGLKAVAGGLVILTTLDYYFYWPETTERIAATEVSRQEIDNLPVGDARGSAWSGCYAYQGRLPLGGGGGSGDLKIAQADGVLKVEVTSMGSTYSLAGGIDRNGRFRFGGEFSLGQNTYREIWQGRFRGTSFNFKRRTTVPRTPYNLGVESLSGTAQLIPCGP